MNKVIPSKRPDSEQNSLTSLWQIFAFVIPYKLMLTLALVALVTTAGISLSIGQGVKLIIDSGFIAGSVDQLKNALVIMLIMISLLAIGTFSRHYLMSWLGERASADIRKAVFEKIVVLHPSFFEENRSGEIMSRLTTDTALLQSIMGSYFSMALRSLLILIGGMIMLFATNFKLSLIVVFSVPVILLPMFIFGKRVRTLSSNSQDAIAGVGVYAGEIIQNIKVVQSYTREQEEYSAFSRDVEKAFQVAGRRIKQRAFLIAASIFLACTSVGLMLWSGGMDVISGRISGGELGAFAFYAILVAMSFATIAEVYGEIQRAAGSSARLLELLKVESDIKIPAHPEQLHTSSGINITIDQLSFSYPSRPHVAALHNINIAVTDRQVIAIVGPSGAGKTTLFDMLQRFYDPKQGMIQLNGIDIRKISLERLRKLIGLVPQNPILFSSSVLHNIAYGHTDASEHEIINAAKKAHAHEFITRLPQGYDSFLGEQGVRLSGGQKQRIAIARAILKNPDILLLDEATSALDSESEQHVQVALAELMQNRTTFIIAHRLSTVLHANNIIVMNEGQVIATGSHETLIKSNELYKRLCDLQFKPKS